MMLPYAHLQGLDCILVFKLYIVQLELVLYINCLNATTGMSEGRGSELTQAKAYA